MSKYRRDIILVIKDDAIQPRSIDTQVECLNYVIACVENREGFCRAHELVNRNRITSSKRKILSAVKNERLKPFRFLLNKN
ncbi:hypothetical protein U0035_10545 [Niabella yanshanensis]|uniref:Uncharacterized protein n=1 Tax=Niabella yanshanensis TaxID=577386 RepID=A0ABZ0WD18_9BACT|nr:hypothetical protein [Niabella yanshanensis]WQD40586.1 hypothetical protein U0035_10545 [Niabella yanshanensis]